MDLSILYVYYFFEESQSVCVRHNTDELMTIRWWSNCISLMSITTGITNVQETKYVHVIITVRCDIITMMSKIASFLVLQLREISSYHHFSIFIYSALKIFTKTYSKLQIFYIRVLAIWSTARVKKRAWRLELQTVSHIVTKFFTSRRYFLHVQYIQQNVYHRARNTRKIKRGLKLSHKKGEYNRLKDKGLYACIYLFFY